MNIKENNIVYGKEGLNIALKDIEDGEKLIEIETVETNEDLNTVEKLKEKLKQLTSRSWGISTSHRVMKLKQLIVGWVNYFKIGQMKTLCKELDEHLRFRLRMCIWKQWKKVKTRYKNLQKLGIPREKAWEWANTRKGYARVARSFILCRSITNERLKKFGLVSLLDQYQKAHI